MASDAFKEDDYDEVNSRYFAGLRSSGQVETDPSGWLDTRANAAVLAPPVEISPCDLQYYYVDEGDALDSTKQSIVGLISRWENRYVSPEQTTLFHSVSTATLATLVVLRRLGVKSIIFETPGYAVTMNQANCLGLNTIKIPTYRERGFALDLPAETIGAHSPCAVWITQPRMSLGYDQSCASVERIASFLSQKDFLVIDEATEQRFPSLLREIYRHPFAARIIRLRGLLKGTGLNGLRLAFALHDESLRSDFESSQEVTGSSLDIYSLRAAVAVATRKAKLPSMLEAANAQVTSLREQAEMIAYGSRVEVLKLVNGYIGSLLVDLRCAPGSYKDKRGRLLSFCQDRSMPVILGASMRFAFDPSYEPIRLNYFSHPSHILRGVSNIVDFTLSI